MRKLVGAAVLAAVCSMPVAGSASTYPPVEVTLDVSVIDDRVDRANCRLSVPRDSQGRADGFDVLDEAVRQGCITSYDSVEYPPYGRFLTCIDGICGQDVPTWVLPTPTAYVGTTWTLTINDAQAGVGLDTYEARANDEVGLTYSTYAFPA